MADGTLDIGQPTVKYSVRDLFGIDSDMEIMGFADATDRVPDIDTTYQFDHDTTLAILAGFVYVQTR